ncbi:hypothetical protein BH23BAC2_BH23BAC2_07480 [soil metagenome]
MKIRKNNAYIWIKAKDMNPEIKKKESYNVGIPILAVMIFFVLLLNLLTLFEVF